MVHEVSDGQAARHDKGSLQRHGNPPPAFAGEEPCEVTIDAGKVERDFSSAVRYAGVGKKKKKIEVLQNNNAEITSNFVRAPAPIVVAWRAHIRRFKTSVKVCVGSPTSLGALWCVF